MPQPKPVDLDGRIGEGGGQLVRIAVCLSALTGVPIRIHHVRGNRPGKRSGGLKAQHASCINWLADVTQAELTGCFVGSPEFSFFPKSSSSFLLNRNIAIDADSAASTLLVFQAVFPFLLFASNEESTPIDLTIKGGTNVSFSLSFEYLDQVLLPTLESCGLPKADRKLIRRGWTHGTRQIGSIRFTFQPLPPGKTISASSWPVFSNPGHVEKIDITIIAPEELLEGLQSALISEIDMIFPGVEHKVLIREDSGHPARVYTLLVARTSRGFRLGRDWLYDKTTRSKDWRTVAMEVSRKVVDELDREVSKGLCVDEYLQDQLIIYQALAEGHTVVQGSSGVIERERADRTERPSGSGSMHAQTARWVASQLLPGLRWTGKGSSCYGTGWKRAGASSLETVLKQ